MSYTAIFENKRLGHALSLIEAMRCPAEGWREPDSDSDMQGESYSSDAKTKLISVDREGEISIHLEMADHFVRVEGPIRVAEPRV